MRCEENELMLVDRAIQVCLAFDAFNAETTEAVPAAELMH
jgi:hypothetical protein